MATKDDAAARFVAALQWAVQLAAEGKDGETALAAAEALSEGYEMAVGEIKVAIFQRLAAQSRSVEEYTALARDAMDTARQVADSDEFIAARQLGEIAVDMARAARNGESWFGRSGRRQGDRAAGRGPCGGRGRGFVF